MRHSKVDKRQVEPDKVYNNILVTRFINRIMKDGKKTVAQKQFYNAFEIIKQQGQEPLEVFEKALQNVSPKQEVIAKRVGGASYQVPMPVRPARRTALSIRWLIEAARNRSNKEYRSFAEKLAAELMAAVAGEGEAMRKKDIMHRQAEANKAFSHFRF